MSPQSEDKKYDLGRLREERTFEPFRRYLRYLRYAKESTDFGGNTFFTASVALTLLSLPTGTDLE